MAEAVARFIFFLVTLGFALVYCLVFPSIDARTAKFLAQLTITVVFVVGLGCLIRSDQIRARMAKSRNKIAGRR